MHGYAELTRYALLECCEMGMPPMVCPWLPLACMGDALYPWILCLSLLSLGESGGVYAILGTTSHVVCFWCQQLEDFRQEN